MKIKDTIRQALQRDRRTLPQDHARAVDEQRSREQAEACKRPGGPVDPGFVA